MRLILTIASREFRSLFISPLAWSILAILQFILAYLLLSDLDNFNVIQTQLATLKNAPGLTDLVVAPLYSNASIMLLLITPLLTMRIICQERRNKTLVLLLSAPVSNVDIVLGKFFGVLGLQILIILLISLMPLSLLFGGTLDFGKCYANLLGIILLLTSFTALGVYMSSLAAHPTIAAISTYGLLILLWMVDSSASLKNQGHGFLEYISILKHFQNLQSGLVSSTDIGYFLIFTGTFLLLSIRSLDNERLQK
jgi:ABC-2 type transport system permease protein